MKESWTVSREPVAIRRGLCSGIPYRPTDINRLTFLQFSEKVTHVLPSDFQIFKERIFQIFLEIQHNELR